MNRTEERLRAALSATAEAVQPDELGSLDRIRAGTVAARRRRHTTFAVVGMAAAIAVAVAAVPLIAADRKPDVITVPPATSGSTDGTTDTSGTASTQTSATTIVTTPPPVSLEGVLWPQSTDQAGVEARDVAERFVREFLGFGQALVGEATGNQVPVLSTTESGSAGPLVSMVTVREIEGGWYVTGASSDSIVVDSPTAFADATSPLAASGQGRGYEATINAYVLGPDGAELGPIGQDLAGCCEELLPYSIDVGFEVPAAGTGALVVANTTGAEFATPNFTVVPVVFGGTPGAGVTTLQVFFLDENGEVTPVTRTVTRTLGVLRAALEQLLAGPTPEEGVFSGFSSDTAGMLLGVTINAGGLAIVDFDASLLESIPNSSTSAMSAALIAQLNATVFQFASVQSIEYRLAGDCEAFWNSLEGTCHTESR